MASESERRYSWLENLWLLRNKKFCCTSRPYLRAARILLQAERYPHRRIYVHCTEDFSARTEESWAKWRKVEPDGFRLELLGLGLDLAPDHSDRHPLIWRVKTRLVRLDFVLWLPNFERTTGRCYSPKTGRKGNKVQPPMEKRELQRNRRRSRPRGPHDTSVNKKPPNQSPTSQC